MIIAIPKDTSCQPPMRFVPQWLLLNQPFADYVRPAKCKRQKRNQFPQSLWLGKVSLFQTKPSRLHTSKQRFYLPSLGVVCYGLITRTRTSDKQELSCFEFHSADVQLQTQYSPCSFKHYFLTNAITRKQSSGSNRLPMTVSNQCIGSQSYAKINAFARQVSKPPLANKLTVSAQIRDSSKAKQAAKFFQQIDALSRVRATFLFKDSPKQWECYPLIADAKRHHIKRRVAQIPIRSIQGDGPRGGQPNQFYNKGSNFCIADFKQPKEALHPFVIGSGLRSTRESVSHLNQVYSLDLDERDEEFSQEVDAGFVPSYIIGKRSLQKANVGHCVLSFQDSFIDVLVKDSGTMAFYAFSKINFCPVLRADD